MYIKCILYYTSMKYNINYIYILTTVNIVLIDMLKFLL